MCGLIVRFSRCAHDRSPLATRPVNILLTSPVPTKEDLGIRATKYCQDVRNARGFFGVVVGDVAGILVETNQKTADTLLGVVGGRRVTA